MIASLTPTSPTSTNPNMETSSSKAEDRIKTAKALSVTPESQMAQAAIFSLSGVTNTPTDPGLGNLIYNASTARSRTSDQAIPRTGLQEEQIRDIIKAYSEKK